MTTQDALADCFPIQLPAGLTARLLDAEESRRVMRTVIPRIFPFIDSLGHYRTPEARQPQVDHLRRMFTRSDALHIGFFNAAGEPVGWYYGYLEEETTHHMDTVGLLTEYRGQGVYSAFLRALIDGLSTAGIERVTVIHQPNNRAIMISELKAGFNIVGFELHEERGPQIKMAYFMHEDRRAGFERVFSVAPDPSRE